MEVDRPVLIDAALLLQVVQECDEARCRRRERCGKVPDDDNACFCTRDGDVEVACIVREAHLPPAVGPDVGDDDEVGFLSLCRINRRDEDVLPL